MFNNIFLTKLVTVVGVPPFVCVLEWELHTGANAQQHIAY